MKQAILLAALATASPFAPGLNAQTEQAPELEFPQLSPRATIKERVGLTDVEIEYSRPSVRDRKIFGGLVPYDQVWRTGANASTRVTFGSDVTFGGMPAPAGSYALYTIPGANEWTVILSQVSGQWGSYAYDETKDLLRVKARPVTLPESVETLTIGLGDLRDDSAIFTITWDKTRVHVPIKTDVVTKLRPLIEAVMASDQAEKPYLAAAMFYYQHDLDLSSALQWIDSALEGQPDAVWIVYRKGLILEKLEEKEAALEAAQRALELANQAGGELGAEYKRLSEALIARLE